MTNKHRSFMILGFFIVFFTVFSTAANAQWRMTGSRTDRNGRLTEYHEKNARGDIRTTTWNHFPNNVVRLQRVTTRMVDGTITVIVEERDIQNRVVRLTNTRLNAAGAMVFGARQTWRYAGPRDRYGRQFNEEYDRNSATWRRA